MLARQQFCGKACAWDGDLECGLQSSPAECRRGGLRNVDGCLVHGRRSGMHAWWDVGMGSGMGEARL